MSTAPLMGVPRDGLALPDVLAQKRLQIQTELQKTQQVLHQLDQQRAQLVDVLLRQQGALQLLNELLPPPDVAGA